MLRKPAVIGLSIAKCHLETLLDEYSLRRDNARKSRGREVLNERCRIRGRAGFALALERSTSLLFV
ncbi:hypothetical protein PLANTIT3_61544 [Plantibacter sp. T3]|nr:hypothetical protein PLANTIT3_61544 [Plantibacter sp. T3]